MATVHFKPSSAIKYVGRKDKEFNYSLARPFPILSRGDIVITDEITAYNLVNNKFSNFVAVDEIYFTRKDSDEYKYLHENLKEHKEELENQREETAKLENENKILAQKLAELEKEKEAWQNTKDEFIKEIDRLKSGSEKVNEAKSKDTPKVDEAKSKDTPKKQEKKK